jgi:hypothetical protein
LPVENTGLTLQALAYVHKLYAELMAEHAAPGLGTQNQAVHVVLDDPELRTAVAKWAVTTNTEEASATLSRGVKPAKAVLGSASTLRITETASSGSKVSACSTQMIGAVVSCTPRLIAAARPRVSCRTHTQPGRFRYGDGGVGAAAIHCQHLRGRWIKRGERAQ